MRPLAVFVCLSSDVVWEPFQHFYELAFLMCVCHGCAQWQRRQKQQPPPRWVAIMLQGLGENGLSVIIGNRIGSCSVTNFMFLIFERHCGIGTINWRCFAVQTEHDWLLAHKNTFFKKKFKGPIFYSCSDFFFNPRATATLHN